MINITTNINATVTVTAAVVNASVIACVRGALTLSHRLEHWLFSEGSYRKSGGFGSGGIKRQRPDRKQQHDLLHACCFDPMCQPCDGRMPGMSPAFSGMCS
ncbi:hypothetical protein [uncultured Rubinisphaera sp.]|uniref:hypothetical protein n=1 Tax=uncultured Rubinisphaera sp. TaxID=1678686 RepID=UPI0030D9D804